MFGFVITHPSHNSAQRYIVHYAQRHSVQLPSQGQQQHSEPSGQHIQNMQHRSQHHSALGSLLSALARIFQNAGDTVVSEQLYVQALTVGGDDYKVLNDLALCFQNRGEWKGVSTVK